MMTRSRNLGWLSFLVTASLWQACTGSSSKGGNPAPDNTGAPGNPVNPGQLGLTGSTLVSANQPILLDATSTAASSWSWKQISGPGKVTFENPKTEDTLVSADTDGEYSLQLTATDARGQSLNLDVLFVWDTKGPQIHLTEDRRASAQTTIDAQVGADATEVHWSKVSGPGTMTFSKPDAGATEVSASEDGIYELEFVAFDKLRNVSKGIVKLTWDTQKLLLDLGDNIITNHEVAITPKTATGTTYQWTQTRGEGKVTFSSPKTAATDVKADTDGEYELTLTATSTLGATEAKTLKLTWDKTDPVLTAKDKTYRSRCIQFSQPALSMEASGADSFEWKVTSRSPADAAYQFSQPTSKNTGFIADDGTFELELVATDAAGNIDREPITVTCKHQSPTLKLNADNIGNHEGVPLQNAAFVLTAQTDPDVKLEWSVTHIAGVGAKLSITDAGSPERRTLAGDLDGYYTVFVVATDSFENTATESYQFIWNAIVPTVEPLPNVVTNQSKIVSPKVRNATSYKWTRISGPNDLKIDSPSSPSTTISADHEGTWTIGFEAFDKQGSKASLEFEFKVDTTKPTIEVPDHELIAQSIHLDARVSGASSYVWSMAGATFSHINNPSTDVIVDQDGKYVAMLTATDEAGNAASQAFTFTRDTTKPKIELSDDLKAFKEKELNPKVSDLTAVTYEWSQISGPGTLSFDPKKQAKTLVSSSENGDYVLQLKATDAAGNFDEKKVKLIWSNAAALVDLGEDIIKNGRSINLQAKTGEADTFVWEKISGPAQSTVTFSNTTKDGATARFSQDGVYELRLSVSTKGGQEANDTLKVTIDTVKPEVVLNDIKVPAAQVKDYLLSPKVDGADTYLWTMVSGPAGGQLVFDDAKAPSTKVKATANGTYTLRFTATDLAGNRVEPTATLLWDDEAPTVTVGSNKLTSKAYTPPVTTSPDVERYLWSVEGGSTALKMSAFDKAQNTISTSATYETSYKIVLKVWDKAGNTAEASFSLIWDPIPPYVSFHGAYLENAPVQVHSMTWDAVTFEWSKKSGPGQVTFSDPKGADTLLSADKDGSYVIELKVTDAAGNEASATNEIRWVGESLPPWKVSQATDVDAPVIGPDYTTRKALLMPHGDAVLSASINSWPSLKSGITLAKVDALGEHPATLANFPGSEYSDIAYADSPTRKLLVWETTRSEPIFKYTEVHGVFINANNEVGPVMELGSSDYSGNGGLDVMWIKDHFVVVWSGGSQKIHMSRLTDDGKLDIDSQALATGKAQWSISAHTLGDDFVVTYATSGSRIHYQRFTSEGSAIDKAPKDTSFFDTDDLRYLNVEDGLLIGYRSGGTTYSHLKLAKINAAGEFSDLQSDMLRDHVGAPYIRGFRLARSPAGKIVGVWLTEKNVLAAPLADDFTLKSSSTVSWPSAGTGYAEDISLAKRGNELLIAYPGDFRQHDFRLVRLKDDDGLNLRGLSSLGLRSNKQTLATAAHDGTNAMVVWCDDRDNKNYPLMYQLVNNEGSKLWTNPRVLDKTDCGSPQITFNGTSYVVAWNSKDGSVSAIKTAVISTSGIISPSGIQVLDKANTEAGITAFKDPEMVSTLKGETVVIYGAGDGSYSSTRIQAKKLDINGLSSSKAQILVSDGSISDWHAVFNGKKIVLLCYQSGVKGQLLAPDTLSGTEITGLTQSGYRMQLAATSSGEVWFLYGKIIQRISVDGIVQAEKISTGDSSNTTYDTMVSNGKNILLAGGTGEKIEILRIAESGELLAVGRNHMTIDSPRIRNKVLVSNGQGKALLFHEVDDTSPDIDATRVRVLAITPL